MSPKPPDREPSPTVPIPPRREAPFKSLGVSEQALRLGVPPSLLSGHWCSRCAGIWFGALLEAECPQCGNRHG